MITVDQYFIGREHTDKQEDDAARLLVLVNSLIEMYQAKTLREVPINPLTHSQIAGVTEGGFRLQSCMQGAPNSAHKQAQAVDVFDPKGTLDNWITDDILEEHDLYREAPQVTGSWCHLTTRPPASGRRTFFP